MIPAEFREDLGIAIGRLFPPNALDIVMVKVTGDSVYQVVARGLSDRDTARDLVAYVSENDLELMVLAELLSRQPTDVPFGKLIDAACPGARQRLPTTRENVNQVITGIAAVVARLGDPATRQAIESSREKLAEIGDRTESFKIYKNLHEYLHLLQVKQFQTLRAAARKLPDSQEQAQILDEYQAQLSSACVSALSAVEELSDPARRQTEIEWINALDQSSVRFHTAIRALDAKSAQAELRTIRRVMRSVPSRLNSQIATTAKVLPLGELDSALSTISTLSGDGAVKTAHVALRRIMPTIGARVTEHRAWQEVDVRITDLEQLIEQQPADLVDEFGEGWLEVTSLVNELIEREPSADWTAPLQSYAVDVGDRMTEVERHSQGTATDNGERAAREQASSALESAFAAFRRNAQLRFLRVDANLKNDCGELIGLGRPLRDMLAAL